jgi:drug/metabolite transporter (DMT)-like permease
LYSERLDAWTVLGAALILLGNLLNLKPAAPAPTKKEEARCRASSRI